jgi:hypothetical protein
MGDAESAGIAADQQGGHMNAEARMARKAEAQDRKYSLRYKPRQTGRSVFTIQQVQAKRAEQRKNGRAMTRPSHSYLLA